VEVAYRRGDLVAKRHRMMQAWADYMSKELAGTLSGSSNEYAGTNSCRSAESDRSLGRYDNTSRIGLYRDFDYLQPEPEVHVST